VAGEPEVEQAPDPRHVAPDRGVHEAREERDAGDAQQARLGVDPRSNLCLEYLHRGSDEMEHQDDLRLLEGFELQGE